MSTAPLHIISHTDLDGVAAAAVAWHRWRDRRPLKVSLAGYGTVDALILESLDARQDFIVLDLFCQDGRTVETLDRVHSDGAPPFVFDHHETTAARYGARPWLVTDTSVCAAKVYYQWLLRNDPQGLDGFAPLVDLANDRDLWLNQNPDSRLWQALITLCGPYSLFTRLAVNPGTALAPHERTAAMDFVDQQEKRFAVALQRTGTGKGSMTFVEPGILEFGDVSDFGGLVLDRMAEPPLLVAVVSKRFAGDWAVSLRSRDETAGKVVGMLRDGRKVRGGGHGDSAALYFPASYSPDQIRSSLEAALRTIEESERPTGFTLGDLMARSSSGARRPGP
ncbi:MAG TPA: phosphohydrolase [Synergistaceae bacterium]|nr:phosphohydrolase [Synergistaceae bacterium]